MTEPVAETEAGTTTPSPAEAYREAIVDELGSGEALWTLAPTAAVVYLVGRDLTSDEAARLPAVLTDANVLLRRRLGPITVNEYPVAAWTWGVARMVARHLDGAPLVADDVALLALAADAAALRPPHPFTRGYGGGTPIL